MRNDALRYPRELIEDALGPQCVDELKKAEPQEWQDSSMLHNRFVINAGALGYWLFIHLGVNIFNDKQAEAITVDPLSEMITVWGADYQIPHWCYLSQGILYGDERPSTWPGIRREFGETLEELVFGLFLDESLRVKFLIYTSGGNATKTAVENALMIRYPGIERDILHDVQNHIERKNLVPWRWISGKQYEWTGPGKPPLSADWPEIDFEAARCDMERVKGGVVCS